MVRHMATNFYIYQIIDFLIQDETLFSEIAGLDSKFKSLFYEVMDHDLFVNLKTSVPLFKILLMFALRF